LAGIVIGASVVSVVGLFAFRGAVPLDDLRRAADGMGNYLQTVGGIYAVLLAFVVYVVWNQFDAARAHVDRESAAVVDLHRTASGLPKGTRDRIQKGLRAYVDAVLNREWEAMVKRDETTIASVGELLDDVWLAIHSCQPANECQVTIYGEVLSRFNDLTDVRTSRLTSSRQRIPISMKVLLVLGALTVIGSAWMMVFDPLWIHATVVGALSGAVAHILYLIVDLDDPFAGRWTMSKAPFERAREAFERGAHGVDADEPAVAA
jgi:hypothetical protein